MGLKAGDTVFFRIMPGMEMLQGTIESVEDALLTLRSHDKLPTDLAPGRYVIIPEADTDCDYYTEVTEVHDELLHLKRLWTGKRDFFRVDDVFPVLVRKISFDASAKQCRIITGFSTEDSDESTMPDGTVSPQVWKMLVNINTKLEMILEKLSIESEGLTQAHSTPVNVSASGIRLTIPEIVVCGDAVEVKMALPVYPPVAIVTCGEVLRATPNDRGGCEVALQFVDMDDDVRDQIIHYTFNRQREMNRRQDR